MTNLVRVTRGIWRAADELTDLAARCAAVLAAMPPATVIGGPTAARLHGLWLPEPCDEPIEVVLNDPGTDPRELPGSVRPEVHARRRALRREEIVVAHGLPTTSEARTWVDLAESLPAADLVAAGDSVLRGPTGIEDLLRAVRSAAGRRGVVRAREALPLLDGRSRSRPESHLRFALLRGGLPRPEVNCPIYTADGEWLAEPDLHYPRARIALEYHGAHHADPWRMRRDITRTLDVQRSDWYTMTFGPREVFGRSDQIAILVATVLEVRDPIWRRARPRPHAVALRHASGEFRHASGE